MTALWDCVPVSLCSAFRVSSLVWSGVALSNVVVSVHIHVVVVVGAERVRACPIISRYFDNPNTHTKDIMKRANGD